MEKIIQVLKEEQAMQYESTIEYAKKQDQLDPLKSIRSQFYIPTQSNGEEHIYLCGNSLGLQAKTTKSYIEQELKDWEKYGVEGHFHAKRPWMPYHEFLTKSMANIVGAKEEEVVVMNTLTVNLHLMMVSFYQPTKDRYKILIESDAFPSDIYAVESQIKFHGFDAQMGLIKVKPREGEVCLRTEDILRIIEEQGDEIALIMLGGVNYYTGQYFNVREITKAGHAKGCKVGYDMAHGAGNIKLQLHDDGPDFAVWCSYKYINAGPGSLAGCFVHERHKNAKELPRFAGWWGHDKATRFNMRYDFSPIPGAEGWQLSNPPILSMAALKASLDIFDQVGMEALELKSRKLTAYMEALMEPLGEKIFALITPKDPEQRGCQMSIQIKGANKTIYEKITKDGVIADWREPDVIRTAAVPLYNSFEDVFRFVEILKRHVN